jgi:hypothetical protein
VNQPEEDQRPFVESVYIAGPYSGGVPEVNVEIAMATAEVLMTEGFSVFNPLLFHFHDEVYHHSWDDWMHQCLYWVGKCDAVLRLPGVSRGAGMEVEYALNRGIPVFYSLHELFDYYPSVMS